MEECTDLRCRFDTRTEVAQVDGDSQEDAGGDGEDDQQDKACRYLEKSFDETSHDDLLP
jgi:hypothetical protein